MCGIPAAARMAGWRISRRCGGVSAWTTSPRSARRRGSALEPWAEQVAELARRPNVTCKLSGLVTEAGPGWEPGQIAPYADWLLDCFGPGRLMFGSDWPVCTLAATYGQVVALAKALLGDGLSAAETDAVLGQNAAIAYGLSPSGG